MRPIHIENRFPPRIRLLKETMLEARPTVCTERARFYTAAYAANEDKTVIMKRAIALADTLRGMTIFINPGELIVGNQASKNRAAPIFPEYAVEWILKELDEFEKRPGDAFYPSDEAKAELKEICSWWAGKTTLDKGRYLMGPELREIHAAAIIKAEGNLTSGDAHIAVDDERILKIGLGGYRELVREKRAALDPSLYSDIAKAQFYDAILISLDAMRDFILRYADLADHLTVHLAGEEPDPARKAELALVTANCRAISEAPPKTFHEALQLVYFVQLVLQIESNGHSMSLGRLDQYLYPFYRRDIDSGATTDERVLELLENTWVKLYSILKIRSWSHTRYSAGSPLYQNVTIGGQKVVRVPAGGDAREPSRASSRREDAVNELSLLVLWSVGETKLTQPNLSVRFHEAMGEDFMVECIKVIEKGFGMPAFNNDEVVVPALVRLGVDPADALDYAAIGCIEVAVPGKWGYRCTGKHFLNFMRVFMAALHDGRDLPSDRTFCPGTGPFTSFTSYGELFAAWDRQVKYYARRGVEIDAAIDVVLEREAPDILCSAFTQDCIGRGKTIHEGGTIYDFVSGLQVGIANLGNSLAAIKKLVFEEGRIGKEELIRALDSDFAGKEGERLRQILLNEGPKFGNDDDYVDLLLRDAYISYIEEVEKHYTIRHGRGPIGCNYYAGTSSLSSNVPSGAVVPATPDGRRAGSPLAEGCSPSSGTDLKGPTAVFKSISKLPTDRILGGVLLNQKLPPQVIASEADKHKLSAMLRVFFARLKGWHVQYNIVDRATLIDAKKAPERHRDLIVRVAGYSAFFNTLAPDTQDDIIARTEHAL